MIIHYVFLYVVIVYNANIFFFFKLIFSFQIHALSHTRNLCHDNDPSYFQSNCFVECFMTRLSKENLTCRLPYMTGKLNISILISWIKHQPFVSFHEDTSTQLIPFVNSNNYLKTLVCLYYINIIIDSIMEIICKI